MSTKAFIEKVEMDNSLAEKVKNAESVEQLSEEELDNVSGGFLIDYWPYYDWWHKKN